MEMNYMKAVREKNEINAILKCYIVMYFDYRKSFKILQVNVYDLIVISEELLK